MHVHGRARCRGLHDHAVQPFIPFAVSFAMDGIQNGVSDLSPGTPCTVTSEMSVNFIYVVKQVKKLRTISILCSSYNLALVACGSMTSFPYDRRDATHSNASTIPCRSVKFQISSQDIANGRSLDQDLVPPEDR